MLNEDKIALNKIPAVDTILHPFIEDKGKKSIRSVYNIEAYIVPIWRQKVDFWKRRVIQKIQSIFNKLNIGLKRAS